MASAAGGMDIEEVAANTPEKIKTVSVHPAVGLSAYQARQLAFAMDLDKKQASQFTRIAFGALQIAVGKGRRLNRDQPAHGNWGWRLNGT